MSTPSPEQIEAAAGALCRMVYGMEWERLSEDGREPLRGEARAALTAAAQLIANQAKAEALREATNDSRMGPVPHGWNATGIAAWLRARANNLERKSE